MAAVQERVQLSARGPHKDSGGVCALETAGELLFVASTIGTILVFRCVMRVGMLQPLQVLNTASFSAAVTGMTAAGIAVAAGLPSLLCNQMLVRLGYIALRIMDEVLCSY